MGTQITANLVLLFGFSIFFEGRLSASELGLIHNKGLTLEQFVQELKRGNQEAITLLHLCLYNQLFSSFKRLVRATIYD